MKRSSWFQGFLDGEAAYKANGVEWLKTHITWAARQPDVEYYRGMCEYKKHITGEY